MDIYVVVFGRSEGYLKAYTSVNDAITYIQTNFYQDDEIVGAEEVENYDDTYGFCKIYGRYIWSSFLS